MDDHNTNYFHIVTLRRRSKNKIEPLKVPYGTSLEERHNIGNLFVTYFHNLFSSSEPVLVDELFLHSLPRLTQDDCGVLLKQVSKSKILLALKSIESYKSQV